MKLSAIFLTVVVLTGASSLAEAKDYVKTTYVVSSTYAAPLGTNDSCSAYSWAGQVAYEGASNDALTDCESDDNVTCVIVGAQYLPRSSAEFPGYKTCTAKVTVHGFGPK